MTWLSLRVRAALYRDWNAGIKRARAEYDSNPFCNAHRVQEARKDRAA